MARTPHSQNESMHTCVHFSQGCSQHGGFMGGGAWGHLGAIVWKHMPNTDTRGLTGDVNMRRPEDVNETQPLPSVNRVDQASDTHAPPTQRRSQLDSLTAYHLPDGTRLRLYCNLIVP